MKNDSKIILLADILDLRARQKKELAFYTEKKEKLEQKLYFINKEIELTEMILKMIEKEQITEIKK